MRSLEGPLLFLAYFAMSIALLAGFMRLYFWATPYDKAADIAKGHMAAAIALAGAMLGFTFPLLVASFTHATLLEFLAWSAFACVVQLAAFWVLYRFLPTVIETNNIAGATCFAITSICVGLLNTTSFIP